MSNDELWERIYDISKRIDQDEEISLDEGIEFCELLARQYDMISMPTKAKWERMCAKWLRELKK